MFIHGFLLCERDDFLSHDIRKNNVIFVQQCDTRSLKTIMNGLGIVREKYESHGLDITDYYSDNDFDKEDLKKIIMPAIVHI